MKKYMICLLLVLFVSSVMADFTSLELGTFLANHKKLAEKCIGRKSTLSHFRMHQAKFGNFSIFHSQNEASLSFEEELTQYLLYLKKEKQDFGYIINFKLYIIQGEKQTILKAKLLKTRLRFEFKKEDVRGYDGEMLLKVAMQIKAGEKWWQGLYAFSPYTLQATRGYSSKAEAVRHVPQHVQPKDCFVWGSGTNWMVIPGTGCAHWVAHQKGKGASTACYVGRAIRVRDAVSGMSQYSLSQARVGDVWTNSSMSHCGIIRRVNSNGSVYVQHCSSGSGGVVYSTFSSGRAYR